ncbi:hydroxymethylbilane synthase [Glycomyces buryatensis]|uniref:Porphobilinogen deaminase n=1 Tax=Glycomyces buryatensis TaxID=2570927 RepID=A0A4S8QE66_9ACTN|nr:hydroxymethylbilane synthase [Glycomyces buryatensis]THV39479.1 hydroxymethylbilane synthase [Glycomyces buryatensis]
MNQPLRIVTRSSPMALAQVERVRSLLAETDPGLAVEVVPITTTADKWTGSLTALGGKANFVKEIDAVLAAGAADVAVHCLKDMPGETPLPEGMTIAAYLDRDDVRDCLISPAGHTLAELPQGSRVGTSSVRRRAQLAAIRPDLEFEDFRGNANRRLEKLFNGEVDAAVLAVSGLERIGRTEVITEVFEPETVLPPVGAGILALQCREDDSTTIGVLAPLNDPKTWREADCERMFLHVLQGHCNSPIAGYATEANGELTLRGAVYSLDGKTVLTARETAGALAPADLGTAVALAIAQQGGRGLIESIDH